jgi:hypothetical protein
MASILRVEKIIQQETSVLATCFYAGFLLNYFFDPEDEGDVPPKRRLTLNGLHDVISQKLIPFITAAVKTSNPTNGGETRGT